MKELKYWVVKNNGKYWVRTNRAEIFHDMMIYKVNTDHPYIRWCGILSELTDEMKAQLEVLKTA